MRKSLFLSVLALSFLTVSCGKKDASSQEQEQEQGLEQELEQELASSDLFEDDIDITEDLSSTDLTTSDMPAPKGERTVAVKLARTKIKGDFGKYFEVVEHDDYFIDVPSHPDVFNKMSISLEIRRIAEGWPNGWESGKEVANSYLSLQILSKKGKELLAGGMFGPEKELDGLEVGESKWYSFDLSDGHGGFVLTDEELETIDKVEIDDSAMRLVK